MANLIAVTGATGFLGGRVAHLLAERELPQRLVVRDASRAPTFPGATTVGGVSYGDFEAMRSALTGVETLLFVSATESEHRVAEQINVVDAAKAAGVRRIVYISFLGASGTCVFTFARHHWATEEQIRSSGMAFTFLRDNLYLDVLPYFPGADGVVRGPAGNGRFGGVARADVADAAVGALTTDGHDGVSYDVTGPASISMADVAADLTRASGQLITFDHETLDQAYASRAKLNAPEWEVAGWVSSYAAIAAGELDVVSDSVQRLAGHPPMSFATYLERNPAVVDRLRSRKAV
jgi:NAD(P)H dehydrogenase (quinone)